MAEQVVDVKLLGDKELQAAIADIMRHTKDLREPWRRFYRPAFYRYVDDWWEDRGRGATGRGWGPYKNAYRKWKFGKGGGGAMMTLGGDDSDLKGALKGGAESIFRPEPRSMEIGATWDGGTPTPWGRMIIYAQAPAMKKHMTEAAQDHAAWYAEKWGSK